VIIADTGFFLALANADDLHHNAALKAFGDLNEPLITTWPVMTETSHLMLNRVGQQDLLSQIYSTRQLMTHLIWSLGRKISLFTASFALRNVSPEAELSIGNGRPRVGSIDGYRPNVLVGAWAAADTPPRTKRMQSKAAANARDLTPKQLIFLSHMFLVSRHYW